MFLAGADGQTPELRAPSIKGAMRFWWRALNGHLSKDELQEQELKIFGGVLNGAAQRSDVLIQVLKRPHHISTVELLPHKEDRRHRSPRSCFPAGEEFTVEMRLVNNNCIKLIQIDALFKIIAILGGLGKRSRRGLGGFQVLKVNETPYETPENIDQILALCKIAIPSFSFSANANYPIIKDIKVGEKVKTVEEIGQITHDEKMRDRSRNHENYNSSIGAGSPRFASPIYISILPSGKPIVTTLQTASPNPRNVVPAIQSDLKNSILS